MTGASGERRHPPVWAEAILRALLSPRNRDTISGDLLEEYCEVALPQRGELGARLWYVRQVVSFITIAGLIRATVGWLQEDSMFEKVARSSWTWLAAGSLGVLVLFGSLVDNEGAASGIGVGLGLVMAGLGGGMVPLELFSDTLRTVSKLTPHSWAYEAFAEIQRHNGTLVDILPQLAALTALLADH